MTHDVKMHWVEDDIKKIQTKTNLYIQQYGPAGVFHLLREIIQNGFDECEDSDSPGSHVIITHDLLTDTTIVEDDGRGFPETDYPVDIFCTKIQSGSKFFREGSGASAGEFGLGLTACNALAETFKLQIFRDNENYTKTIHYSNGDKVDESKRKLKSNEKRHGSIITFKPSKKFLGVNAVTPLDDLKLWIEKMMFLMNPESNLKVELIVTKGMKVISKDKYKPRPFSELLQLVLPADQKVSNTNSLYIEGEKEIVETVRQLATDGKDKVIEKEIPRKVKVQVVLGYCNDNNTLYDSYCNFTNTTKGGVHLNTFEQVFCRYMASKTTNSMSDAQKEKTKILWEDVKSGLCAVINLSTDAQVGFVGNAKQEVGNEELAPIIKEIINDKLNEFFTNNQSTLNDMIKTIKTSAKARIEMAKVKAATQKERMTSLKELMKKKYIPCNNHKKGEFRELFIVEGDSPSGAGRNGCDPDTQAFLMFRGVTANAFKYSLAEIMQNNEFSELVDVLRCGIGDKFNINNLYFKRINIMTDADIDGFGISASILGFFYRFMPQLIENGYVYKVFTPLYKLNDKEHQFVRNKTEIIDMHNAEIQRMYKIRPFGDKSYFNSEEMYEFLDDVYDYSNHLTRLSKSSGDLNKFLCERIIALLVMAGHIRTDDDYDDIDELFSNQTFIMNLMSSIQTDFPESKFIGGTKIESVVDGKLNTVRVSPRFIQKCADLIPVYKKYGYMLEVKSKGKDPERMSIGKFIDLCQKLKADILYRYKGLGELEAAEIKQTTLAMDNRISVQFTMEDVEKELEIFNTLYSQSSGFLEKRKQMMQNYKIKFEDLDN